MRFKFILFIAALFTFCNVQANNNFNLKTIVIDAGHGGKDPGAVGYAKTYEKDVALAVALKFGAYIQKHFPDVKVIYTRKTDEFLELHQRAEIANKAKADLFIAIHCNSSTNSEFYGTSSYILGLHRTEANLEVAKRENAVILLEDNQEKNYEFNPNTPEGHIIMSMKQNAFLDQSIDFAAKIEGQLENYASRKSMGVKQAGFYVLYKTAMPSLLAEIGFISNPEEEKYLNSTRGQDQIASALFNAFKDYKAEMEGGTDAAPVAEKEEVPAPAPVKKETPAAVKPTPTPAPPVAKETAKETVPPANPPAPKETPPVAEAPKTIPESNAPEETTPVTTPPPAKEMPVPSDPKPDPAYVTLADGIKIKKPVELAEGGGKATAKEEVAVVPVPVEKKEVKETKPLPVETSPKTVVTKQPAAITETKNSAPEKKPAPAPVKTEVKIAETTPSPVKSNRHPLVPVSMSESGTIFKIQLFSLKGELKEYDKFIKMFKVLTAEELSNGITRYYGAKTTSYAEAKRFHEIAIANGYKDSYIVGFKDGNRMSFDEVKAFEGK